MGFIGFNFSLFPFFITTLAAFGVVAVMSQSSADADSLEQCRGWIGLLVPGDSIGGDQCNWVILLFAHSRYNVSKISAGDSRAHQSAFHALDWPCGGNRPGDIIDRDRSVFFSSDLFNPGNGGQFGLIIITIIARKSGKKCQTIST
jgi:hypothetical protein